MTLLYVHLILFQCWLELLFSHFLLYQGGSAFAKTSASFFLNSSPSWGNMATYPMTYTMKTQRCPRNYPSTRCLKSLPCFIRRRVWWSLKVLANTLCRRPNCASTCRTNTQNCPRSAVHEQYSAMHWAPLQGVPFTKKNTIYTDASPGTLKLKYWLPSVLYTIALCLLNP